jgi:1-phosphatidylinositol-4-phosphate 5-kinase
MIWAVEDGTPAAEALRANADVKVTKVGKAARFLHVQTVRNSAKKILHVGSGAKRGKPPRIPGTSSQDVSDAIHTEELEKDDATSRRENGNLDILPEDPNEDEMHDYESVFDEEDGQPQILMSQSSDSSDAGVPTKIAIFESEPSSLVLLDAKGKKQEVLLDRKMKKKMKKPKKKKPKRNYVKGKVIDGQHELYALSIAMMLGLRYSIFLTNNQILKDRKNVRMWLDSDEFMKVEKYSFRPDGGNNTPPHQLSHTFKFKDYSPLPFAFIRRMFGINEYEFHHSVCGNANFIEFISNAKSGQFFFYSSDGKYMIKTMTNSESKFLRRSKSEISPSSNRFHVANPIMSSHAFIILSNASSTSLLSALRTESKYNPDKIFRDVSSEAISSAQKCEICHYELSL